MRTARQYSQSTPNNIIDNNNTINTVTAAKFSSKQSAATDDSSSPSLRRRKPQTAATKRNPNPPLNGPTSPVNSLTVWPSVPRWLLWLTVQCVVFLTWLQSFGILYIIAGILLFRAGRFAYKQEWKNDWRLSVPTAVLAAINVFLVACVFHSSFRLALFDSFDDVQISRVGHISMESAKIWVRYPNSTALPFEELDLALFYRSVLNETDSEWLRGPSALLTHQSDWVGVVQLDGLQANTEYEYAWIVQAADSVRTLPFSQNGRAVTSQQLPPPIEHFRFKTAPVSGNPHDFQFVFGSCIKPNYPYGQGLPGFAAVSRQRPAFLLMLGDFIYIDIVVNFGASLGNYLRHYREVLGQTETVQLLSSTPMYGINDDHEILNNWDRGNTGPFINAMAAFDLYVASANPSLPNGSQSDVSLPKPKYYQFEHGDAAFFVTDTRTFRNPFGGTAAAAVDRSYFDSLPFNHPDRTMLGKQQLKELLGWLQRVNNTHTFKFLVTSVPFTFNFPNDDTWYAYQYERQLILDHIDRNSITNVIVLSGDRHQIAVKDFLYAGSENSSAPLATEFSVSPISQFWVPIPFYFETSNSFSGSSGKRFPDSKWIEDRRVFYSYNVGPINVGKMIVQTERAYESSANPPLPSVTFCLYRPRSTWWWRWLVESWSSLLFDTPLDQETAERCSAGSDSAVDDNNNDQLVYHHTIYGKLIERATGWEQQRNSGGVEQTSTQFPSNDLIDGVWNWMRSLIR